MQQATLTDAHRRWLRFLPAILLSVIIAGAAAYANLSFRVENKVNYKYFPPFRPYADFNMNDHLGAEYFNVARSVYAGGGFADPFGDHTGPTAWMPPVFPCILAGLLWVCGGNENAVMVLVIILQIGVLISSAWLMLVLVQRSGTRTMTAWAASAIFLGFLICDYFLWFQFTHDIWLVMFALDVVIAGYCWLRPLATKARAAAWGMVGGICALTNPIVAFVWAALAVRLAIRERAWYRLAAMLAVAGIVVLPWTCRNYRIFGRWIPVKSNLSYELYQSQCLTDHGLLERDTFYMHPYTTANWERSAYKKLGESAYLDSKWVQFRKAELADPAGSVRRVGNRFVAATLWYVPFDHIEEWQIPEWVFWRRVIYPLPFLAVALLAVSAYWRPLTTSQWTVIAVYTAYVLPYVVVSYYDRYAVPLVAIKAVLVFWGAERAFVLAAAWLRARKVTRRATEELCVAGQSYSVPLRDRQVLTGPAPAASQSA